MVLHKQRRSQLPVNPTRLKTDKEAFARLDKETRKQWERLIRPTRLSRLPETKENVLFERSSYFTSVTIKLFVLVDSLT